MKKGLIGAAAVVLILSVAIMSTFAAGHGRGRNCVNVPMSAGCEQEYSTCHFADEDENGICDSCMKEEKALHHAGNFVDRDQDGVCDYESTDKCFRNYSGNHGAGHGRDRHGRCRQ